jgi:Predicted signal transduction protein with a C-terminal ATPase domain
MILGTVRGRIIASSALILFVLSLATLYTGFASSELARSVELLFRNNRMMEGLSGLLDQTEASLAGYLTTKSSDSLKDYIRYSTKLSDEARKLDNQMRQDQLVLLQRDLSGLVDDYLENTEAAVVAKRGRDVASYTRSYEASGRSAELARYVIGQIDGIFLSQANEAYSSFSALIPPVIVSNALLVVAAALMSFMLLVSYSYRLTMPLTKLAEAAKAVGRGEYDSELPAPQREDEIGTTTAAFASMQLSVRRAFEELKEKAEVEKRLMEERMRVLELDHKLKDAELLALQTQINPHFLFNTLSAGMQLALAEDADRTADFLDNLAAFIRYVLKPPGRFVLIADEIECLERYIWLLKLRFGERYAFELSVEEEALEVETPALVLQPLVENAVAHGLKDVERGGEVRVTVRMEEGFAVMEVVDTGEGMGPEEVERITREGRVDESWPEAGRQEAPEGPATGGIGLRNVMRRVALATGGRGGVSIESSPGRGTRVRVELPAPAATEAPA